MKATSSEIMKSFDRIWDSHMLVEWSEKNRLAFRKEWEECLKTSEWNEDEFMKMLMDAMDTRDDKGL